MKIVISTVVDPMTTRVNKTGAWRSFKPIFNREKCTKCGICALYCPDGVVLKMEDGYFVPDYDFCKGCSICANECPKKSIVMVLEEK